MGGSCAVALQSLRESLPATTQIAELGYLAGEMRGSITLDARSRCGVPTLTENFFEFVAREAYQAGGREYLKLGPKLQEGEGYYLVVTTVSGRFRYFMNDIVKVEGRFHNTPMIRFLQKGRGVTSITGEKLYESQVLEAVFQAELSCGGNVHFFVVLADVENSQYTLLLQLPGGGQLTSTGRC